MVVSKKKSALAGAVKELDTELSSLSKQRSALKTSIDRTSHTIETDRKHELELQQRISSLAEKEAELAQKKKGLENKSDKVTEKISKMSKIKAEMKDL